MTNLENKSLLIPEKESLFIRFEPLGIERIKEDNIQIWSWLNRLGVSAASKAIYEPIIRRFFTYHFNVGLKEVRTPHITLWLKQFPDVAPETLNNYRNCLNALFGYLQNTGYLPLNPVSLTKSASVENKFVSKSLHPEDIKRILSSDLKLRDQVIVHILYFLALRVSELVELKVKSFTEVKGKGARVNILGKGKKVRILFTGEGLWELIKSYIAKGDLKSEDYLFLGYKGNHLSRRHINEILEAIGKDLKIAAKIHAHIFRHTAATHYLDKSGKLHDLQAQLGHSSPTTTMLYAHGSAGRPMADLLD